MKTRFRVKQNDTVKAYASNTEGKLLASLYDSGFTRKSQIDNRLINKIPHYSGKKIQISISNEDTNTYTSYLINVNNTNKRQK